MAIHIIDRDVSFNNCDRKRIAGLNTACGVGVRGDETADTHGAKPALPGYVNQKYNTANNFDVYDSCLVDTGCPNALVSEEHAHRYQDCNYDATAFNLNAANGNIGSTTRLNMSSPLSNDTSPACTLPKIPSVLSDGGRHRMVYTFVLIVGKVVVG